MLFMFESVTVNLVIALFQSSIPVRLLIICGLFQLAELALRYK